MNCSNGAPVGFNFPPNVLLVENNTATLFRVDDGQINGFGFPLEEVFVESVSYNNTDSEGYEDLSHTPLEQLVQAILLGFAHEAVARAGVDLITSGINPAFPEQHNMTSEEQKNLYATVREAHKQRCGDEDVCSWVMRHDPASLDLLLGERISLLVNRTLIHEHNARYCFNTKQRRATETCRFNVPRKLQPVSRIVFKFKVGKCPPTVEVTVKQNHDVLNPHSRAFVAANGANADLRLVLDSESAIAYVVKYTLKNSGSKPFLQDLQRVFPSQAAIGVLLIPTLRALRKNCSTASTTLQLTCFPTFQTLHSMVEVGLSQISYFLLQTDGAILGCEVRQCIKC